MDNYKGMHWLKCDLQMQTPADAQHWIGNQLIAGQEAEAAKAFAEACYQTGLDVIGVTDHNFLSKDFLPYLYTAFDEIESNFKHKINLFPGFEFEAAGVGRGVHVLCLFEPNSDLSLLDAILTECGVAYPRINGNSVLEKSDKNLKDILQIVQVKHKGIVIMPHAMSDDGLFDNEAISEWLQQDQFINPELLAVEVPKPVGKMSSAFQKLFRSGDDCHSDWKRIRPVATIMSSDNKKLIEVDGNQKPMPNSIGYRYSWIKMSDPSVESLRQAFLDHESRIILPDDVSDDVHPGIRFRNSKIHSISIKNVVFLADQEIIFSPNMNCVIGGRGSGKSTLLEYLRIILGKDNPTDLDAGTRRHIDRVKDTLSTPRAELTVCWKSADGVEDTIVWVNGSQRVVGRDLHDPETFFNNLPIRFYSQQQLNRLTESELEHGGIRQAQRLLELVDGFSKIELDELAGEESNIIHRIQDSFTDLRKAISLDKENKRLQQEKQELDRQWKARSEIQEDSDKHQQLILESKYLDELMNEAGKQFSDVGELAKTAAASHISFQVEGSPHANWFKEFDEKVKTSKEELAKTIFKKIEEFNVSVSNLMTDDSIWNDIQRELDQANENFNEACAAKGLSVDDVGHLQGINQSRTKKQHEIDEKAVEIQKYNDDAGDPEVLVEQLHGIWLAQYKNREEAAVRANDLAVLDDGRQRFIEVSAKYQQDYKNFSDLWQEFSPVDGRTRLGRNWENCGKILYEKFISHQTIESPWKLLNILLSIENVAGLVEFGENAEDLIQHIQDHPEKWERLRCSRVKDTVDMKLFRADGTVAGSIAEGSLSDGQRNTAALALLLAQEGGPLVIDQPEDELDSNFVFRELIPMLRKVKSNRQIIMSTHNANLPVNGDAELVYAFEARDGKGEVLAQGGLDQTAVTTAILDIMEGTEEAFRRRREKYHF